MVVGAPDRLSTELVDARARQRGLNPDGSPRRECSQSRHAPAAREQFRRPLHEGTAYDARDPLDWPDTTDKQNAVTRREQGVLQGWVQGLPFMQQTVLLTAVRGPDGARKFHPCKPLLRWYRRSILISAFEGKAILDPFTPGGGSFTGPVDKVTANLDHFVAHWPEYITHVSDAYMEARDELPHHFQMHAMHAFEIVGYRHPDARVRQYWYDLYLRVVQAMHLWPEILHDMDTRLSDDVSAWQARADVSETRGCTVTCSD